MKAWRIVALLSFPVAIASIAIAQSTGRKVNDVHDFMRVKLEHSKKVLEGLTTEDLDLVAKNAQAMSLLSQEATWQVLQTQEYAHRSQDFRRTADTLTQAAKKKNLDGAALAYVELTMKCIDCHKYVRDLRQADGKAKDK